MSSLVKGSVLFFNLYDVAEEIKLDRVRELLGARPQERVFKHAAPEYVRFERPPVIETIGVDGLVPPSCWSNWPCCFGGMGRVHEPRGLKLVTLGKRAKSRSVVASDAPYSTA